MLLFDLPGAGMWNFDVSPMLRSFFDNMSHLVAESSEDDGPNSEGLSSKVDQYEEFNTSWAYDRYENMLSYIVF